MPIIHQLLVELTSRHMSSGDCGKVGDGMVGDTVVEWKAWELPPRWLHHLMALQGGCQVDVSELARREVVGRGCYVGHCSSANARDKFRKDLHNALFNGHRDLKANQQRIVATCKQRFLSIYCYVSCLFVPHFPSCVIL